MLLTALLFNKDPPASDYAPMKTSLFLLLGLCSVFLSSCSSPSPAGGASSFRLTAADHARHRAREERKAQELAASQAATGQTGSLMYQSNQSGPFGSSSQSGMVRVNGPIEAYQTIGGAPVYPGMPVPGYNYYPQPIYVGGGAPGAYWGPTTVRRTVSP